MCKLKAIYEIIKNMEIEIISRLVHSLYNMDIVKQME